MSLPVTKGEARVIILQRDRLHDLQTGLSAFPSPIADEGFSMRFGEKSWIGCAGFEAHILGTPNRNG